MNQPSLLEMMEKQADAIQRSDEHADEAWKQEALEAVRRAAEANETLIVDAVWPYLNEGACATHDYRAMGPVMIRARREGYIAPTGDFRKSHLRNHGTPRPVWRSLIYKGIA